MRTGQFTFHHRRNQSGPRLDIKTVFPGMWFPMLKIRRSGDRLIFNMGILILVRRHLYIETRYLFLFNHHLFFFFSICSNDYWIQQPFHFFCCFRSYRQLQYLLHLMKLFFIFNILYKQPRMYNVYWHTMFWGQTSSHSSTRSINQHPQPSKIYSIPGHRLWRGHAVVRSCSGFTNAVFTNTPNDEDRSLNIPLPHTSCMPFPLWQ